MFIDKFSCADACEPLTPASAPSYRRPTLVNHITSRRMLWDRISRRRISLLAWILFILLPGCDGGSPAPGTSSADAAVNDLIHVIDSCPDWTFLSSDDASGRQRVLDSLRPFQRTDTAIIREVVKRVESKYSKEPGYDGHGLDKLFVLNRYVFNVPSSVPARGAQFFDAWRKTRVREDGSADLLWPLSMDEAGLLSLTSPAAGYCGPPYRALAEFDYFNQRFGRRGAPPATKAIHVNRLPLPAADDIKDASPEPSRT
jgi:hypothetical protein